MLNLVCHDGSKFCDKYCFTFSDFPVDVFQTYTSLLPYQGFATDHRSTIFYITQGTL